ncbi:hypothetical protein [Novosphingobium sp. LASN5T]|uniref:hypothetical protein n=1 Tax=unclassified Novosphingobium TaxID=2644732 RepID=UPI000F5FDFF8|nr:hypothetical protein [Novosphingobium sp. LASN5T]RQW46051.1 hypothetical protein EH199_01390 [Novosphingobium sp. LASN5T]
MLRMILRIFGIVAVLMGGLWMGQGTGLILWPASSFMLDQREWVWKGALLALLGVGALWRASRRRG